MTGKVAVLISALNHLRWGLSETKIGIFQNYKTGTTTGGCNNHECIYTKKQNYKMLKSKIERVNK